eukprot:SAG22_NODE_13064_length_420_cov_0.931464_1_plen_116_part_01
MGKFFSVYHPNLDSALFRPFLRRQPTALFKTTCCEQYACTTCIVEYLQSQDVLCEGNVAAVVEQLPNVKCPYCATPVQFKEVLQSEAPRRYEDSPAVVRKLAARVPGGTYPSGQEP